MASPHPIQRHILFHSNSPEAWVHVANEEGHFSASNPGVPPLNQEGRGRGGYQITLIQISLEIICLKLDLLFRSQLEPD